MIPKIATSTIDNIHGKLGDPKDFDEGKMTSGMVSGQTEEELFGGAK